MTLLYTVVQGALRVPSLTKAVPSVATTPIRLPDNSSSLTPARSLVQGALSVPSLTQASPLTRTTPIRLPDSAICLIPVDSRVHGALRLPSLTQAYPFLATIPMRFPDRVICLTPVNSVVQGAVSGPSLAIATVPLPWITPIGFPPLPETVAEAVLAKAPDSSAAPARTPTTAQILCLLMTPPGGRPYSRLTTLRNHLSTRCNQMVAERVSTPECTAS